MKPPLEPLGATSRPLSRPLSRSLSLSLWWLLARREWRHHPWRHGAALLAVALGVALAYSVHLINSSALNEFSQAVRTANGEPDLSLRGSRFDDRLFDTVATDAAVQIASPVLEIDTYALAANGRRVAVRVMGQDALLAAPLAPALMPKPRPRAAGEAGATGTTTAAVEDRLVFLDPDVVFVNAAAMQALGVGADQSSPTSRSGSAASEVAGTAPASAMASDPAAPDRLQLQAGAQTVSLRLAGTVAAAGPPLLVMDLAGAQHHFAASGQLSRLDLRLLPGEDAAALLARLAPSLPAGVRAVAADVGEQRVSNLSRAYRVNLTVLALVALFVGAFLVFSVISLSVAQRTATLALLGVLGWSASERRLGVLAESAVLGAVGALLGLLMGAGMAAAALRLLAGDLGGGYFPGVQPALQMSLGSAVVFAALGVASAVAGGWWPARQAERLLPAQALKGLGQMQTEPTPAWPGLAVLALGGLASMLPAIAGLPLAAYAAVAAILLGGVMLVPVVVQMVLVHAPEAEGALSLLALQRARLQRHTATAAVAGVVASLALCVALTVMVASFRTGVSHWLTDVLPADLYARSAASSAAADQAWLPADFVSRARALPGVQRLQASRVRSITLASDRPAVALISRPLQWGDVQTQGPALPLVRAALPLTTVAAGETGVYVSEAMVTLYGATQGSLIELPLPALPDTASTVTLRGRVLGVWRDYARQFGTVVVADTDYQGLTGDLRVNDIALWLHGGDSTETVTTVQTALRSLLTNPALLDFASSTELKRISLRIFDRSFAVTYYLQAVAIAIGLVGIAASLSAQVLARRKEFGLLSHLGLTRRQVVAVVAGEGAAWIAAGVLLGLVLGLAISMVLVWVVNPQSFHWTMDLVLPWGRLAALCAAVMLAGTLTAGLTGRSAAGRPAVLSVKEDW